jgi:hypothetical protein
LVIFSHNVKKLEYSVPHALLSIDSNKALKLPAPNWLPFFE